MRESEKEKKRKKSWLLENKTKRQNLNQHFLYRHFVNHIETNLSQSINKFKLI